MVDNAPLSELQVYRLKVWSNLSKTKELRREQRPAGGIYMKATDVN